MLEYVDLGEASFPWPFRARQEFTVHHTGISVKLSVENTGSARMPAGLGIHPWFEASGGLEVALPAEQVYPSAGNIPTGPPIAVAGTRDLRTTGLPLAGMDECWTGLTAKSIELRRKIDGIRMSFSFTASADHVVLAAVDGLGAVAIEPQTHGVDGHLHRERGDAGAIDVLAPGQILSVTYGLTLIS